MRIVIVGAGTWEQPGTLLQRAGHEIVGLTCRTKSFSQSCCRMCRCLMALILSLRCMPSLFLPPTGPFHSRSLGKLQVKVLVRWLRPSGATPPNPQLVIPLGAFPYLSSCRLLPIPAGAENLPGSYITVEGHKQALGGTNCKGPAGAAKSPQETLYHAPRHCLYHSWLYRCGFAGYGGVRLSVKKHCRRLPANCRTLQNIRKTGTTGALTARAWAMWETVTHFALAAKFLIRCLYMPLRRSCCGHCCPQRHLDALGQEQF